MSKVIPQIKIMVAGDAKIDLHQTAPEFCKPGKLELPGAPLGFVLRALGAQNERAAAGLTQWNAFEPLITRIAERYTKLDARCNVLPETATDHTILRDNALGLEWLIPYVSESQLSHADGMAACHALDRCDLKDWRMPTRFEEESTLDLTRWNPAVDPDLFPGTKPGPHWTASPVASDPQDYAWVVYFYYGCALILHRDFHAYVRAVRSVSSPSSPRQ